MFNPLDDAQLEIVIDAMDSKTYNPGDAVITQGEEGNELYVVEEGTLACFKLFVSKYLSDLYHRREKMLQSILEITIQEMPSVSWPYFMGLREQPL
jgi:signal-transduction protein with cAMP-binding, CBS, and nucleotidyltransferase domain